MPQKVAVIIGGLLGCHRLAIDSIMKNVVEPNNADVFILTARRNYVHASSDKLDCVNVALDVTKDDEAVIVKCFGANLKLLRYSEDIPEYGLSMRQHCEKLKENVAWISDSNTRVERYDVVRKTIVDEERYLDQFLRQQFLIDYVEGYEQANGLKYDYIIRLRIDQPIDKRITGFSGEQVFWWNGMDNCFYGSADVIKRIGREFVEVIGKFNVASYNIVGNDYRLTPEVQFIGYVNSLPIVVQQNFICVCWKFYKKDSICAVYDLPASEVERKRKGVSTQEFYKFVPCGSNPHYSLFDTPRNIIWAYGLLDHSRRFSNEV